MLESYQSPIPEIGFCELCEMSNVEVREIIVLDGARSVEKIEDFTFHSHLVCAVCVTYGKIASRLSSSYLN